VNSQAILVVGGYGVVGRRIATELAADYPGRVVIGGRNPARANDVARAIGHGARGCKIDIVVPPSIAAALEGVAVVISCIDRGRRSSAVSVIQTLLRT
jgi:saccharopine dehydrogenase (NAD+, L-lysine forming)